MGKEKVPTYSVDDITFLRVIPNPGTFCVGLNYVQPSHGTTRDRRPSDLTRFADTQVGHQPPCAASIGGFDYEGELAVVMRRGGRHIGGEDVASTLPARLLQRCDSPRLVTSCAMDPRQLPAYPGPSAPRRWPMRLQDVGALTLTTRLKRAVMRHGTHLHDLIFSVRFIVAYISNIYSALTRRHDTPGGILGIAAEPPAAVKEGGCHRSQDDGIGMLLNSGPDDPQSAAQFGSFELQERKNRRGESAIGCR